MTTHLTIVLLLVSIVLAIAVSLVLGTSRAKDPLESDYSTDAHGEACNHGRCARLQC